MAKSQVKILMTAKDQTKAAFKSVNGNLEQLKRNSKVLNTMLGPLAGAASVAGLVHIGKQAINTADEINKLSDRLGASTEALSQYRHVAALSGIEFKTMTMGWQRMTRRVSEAAKGYGEARGALAELGLDAQRLNSLAPEDQFEEIADALAGVGSQSDRVRLAMKLFDSEGVSLVQMMTRGAAGLREMRTAAHEAGMTIEQDMADKASEAKNAMAELSGAITGLGETLVLESSGGLTFFANKLSDIVSLGGDFKEFVDGMTERRIASNEYARAVEKEYEYLQKKYGLERVGIYEGKRLRKEAMANVEAGIDAVSRLTRANEAFAGSLSAVKGPDSYPLFGDYFAEFDQLEELQRRAESLDIDIMKAVTGDDGSLRFEYKTLEDLTKDVNKKLVEIWTSDPPVIPKVTIAAPESLKDEVGLILAEFDALPPVPIKTYLAAPEAAPEDLLLEFGEVGKAAERMAVNIEGAAARGADGMADAIVGAALRGEDALESLGVVATSVFSSIVGGFLKVGLSSALGIPISGFLASGGAAQAGKAYVVGEDGPELFVPSTSGTVIPNGKSTGTAGGGAAATVGDVHVHLNGIWDMTDPLTSRRIGQRVYDEIRVLQTQHGPQGAAK